MYETELTSNDMFNSNTDIQVRGTKTIKLPKVSVTGYKDHSRNTTGFNAGTYSNSFEEKSLDHDRDIEFSIDPMDVDETNQILSIANIQTRFERTQAIPELDCYTFSKIFAEATRVGALIKTAPLTKANILEDFDANMEALEDAGVPLSRCILYCTATYKKILKNAEGVQRVLDVSKGNGLDRRVHTMEDVSKIVVVPKERFKTVYDFTTGYTVDAKGKQIDYILIDPEAQVSRVKYSYIQVFTPGSDSRTADNYLYQNRRFNGTFGLDGMLAKSCIIHSEPAGV
ncbi:MAG: capsid protein [Niameybacter sp.]